MSSLERAWSALASGGATLRERAGAWTDARTSTTFRDPAAAVAGGLTLVPAGVLVALALALHPLPSSGGFAESSSQLADTPLWGPVHFAIAAGFVLCLLGGLLVLVSGGPTRSSLTRFAWAALSVGVLWFTGVALLNAWVMHPLADEVAAGADPLLFDTFNRVLVGFGWLGNPLFLVGLTMIAAIEVRARPLGLPAWLAWGGLAVALLSWLRGVGSAFGVPALEVFILANVPAFLWLAWYGFAIARAAQAAGPGAAER